MRLTSMRPIGMRPISAGVISKQINGLMQLLAEKPILLIILKLSKGIGEQTGKCIIYPPSWKN